MINYRINLDKTITPTEFRAIIKSINELESLPKKEHNTICVDPILVSRAVKIAQSYGYTLTELVSILHDRGIRGNDANKILSRSGEQPANGEVSQGDDLICG